MKKTTKKNNTGKILAGTAAVAVASAAAYALLGPDGKKNRAKITKTVKDAKTKIANNKNVKQAEKMLEDAVKKAKTVAKKEVAKVVKKVSKKTK